MITETRVICRLCVERPVAPSRVRTHDYRCKRCINRTPNGASRLARYNGSAGRQAAQRKANAKRIYVGGAYHSTARTIEDARRINAHIKLRMAGFESCRRAATSGGERDA
jgi:hypothetical protein